jgi:hypothetical protein
LEPVNDKIDQQDIFHFYIHSGPYIIIDPAQKKFLLFFFLTGQNIGGKQETDIRHMLLLAVFSKWTADVLRMYIVPFKARPAHSPAYI